jgi:hypothetical protein
METQIPKKSRKKKKAENLKVGEGDILKTLRITEPKLGSISIGYPKLSLKATMQIRHLYDDQEDHEEIEKRERGARDAFVKHAEAFKLSLTELFTLVGSQTVAVSDVRLIGNRIDHGVIDLVELARSKATERKGRNKELHREEGRNGRRRRLFRRRKGLKGKRRRQRRKKQRKGRLRRRMRRKGRSK